MYDRAMKEKELRNKHIAYTETCTCDRGEDFYMTKAGLNTEQLVKFDKFKHLVETCHSFCKNGVKPVKEVISGDFVVTGQESF